MGYAWQFLDEDRLCWHERVTRTYLAPPHRRVPLSTRLHAVAHLERQARDAVRRQRCAIFYRFPCPPLGPIQCPLFLESSKRPAVKVFVATTVMLTFISFWRAAAIVLSDLASSAYYAGGDAEKVIGKSAPWFILAVMLFSYCVRALYIESSSMFVRGGVYRVVKEAMGSTLAKFSVSALLFDYVLTGPISAVSAGQYLAGFVQDIGVYLHHPLSVNENHFSAVLRSTGGGVFLVEEHPGYSRVERESPADHDHHHRDGGHSAALVHDHGPQDRHPPAAQPAASGVVPLNKESLGWLNGTWFGT